MSRSDLTDPTLIRAIRSAVRGELGRRAYELAWAEARALLRGFVAKSGGMAKMQELRRLMLGVPDGQRAEFVRGCGKNDAGARQFMALALLGIAIACQYGDEGIEQVPS